MLKLCPDMTAVWDFRSIQKYLIVKNNPTHNLDNFTVQ